MLCAVAVCHKHVALFELNHSRFNQLVPDFHFGKGNGKLLSVTEKDESADPILDGDSAETLDKIIPQYLGGRIYSAVCQAIASEHGARRMAMNAANKNATEMIDSLMLGYNRARQAVITQEITEIVSGAEAL